MMKKILIIGIVLFAISLNAQIYTPSSTIQGSSNNNNTGLGISTPSEKLDVNGNILLRNYSNMNGAGAYIHFSSYSDDSAGPKIRSNLFYAAGVNSKASLILSSYFNGYKDELTLNNGKVGIGTSEPTSKLDVRGVISAPEIAFRNADGGDDTDPYRLRKVQGVSNNNWLELQLNDDSDESFRIYGNSCEGAGCGEYSNNLYHSFDTQGNVFHKGNVGIGTPNPNNKLDVNGTIHSKEVKVDMIGWSDFVFKKEYNLPTLEEVEKHITEKGHLENIPGEKEVLENGINLGEMNAKFLQKIEEMTLYMIEQNKRINKLEKENLDLKNKIESIKK